MDILIRRAWLRGTAALLAASVLIGCAGGKTGVAAPQVAATPTPAVSVPQAKPAAEALSDRPGRGEGELVVVTATVKAIDKKNRVVTLKYPDGKEVKVKCGPEVRNFPQIRVGDDVTAEFLTTAELFVTAPESEPAANASQAVKRAPLGSKPGMVAVETVEVTALVEAIDYTTREVKLRGPEGKIIKVKAGPEVKRLNEVKRGDMVVARLTEAVSIRVTSPK